MQPANPADPAVARGIAAMRAGDVKAAEALLRGALARDGRNVEALHFLGLLCFQTGRPDDGVGLVRQATVLAPAYYPALSNLGNMLAALGRARDAIAAYDRAIAIQAANDMPHYNRAIALQGLGRHREALAAYDNAIRLRPTHAQAHSNRGSVLLALSRPEEALAAFDSALGLDPTLVQSHNNRGNSLKALGQFDAALASYDAALARMPGYAEALNNRGSTLQSLGRLAEANVAFDAAIALQPTLAEPFYNRGNTHQQVGNFAAAIVDYERAIALDAGYIKAHYNLGIALHADDRPAEAVERFARCVALQADHFHAIVNQSYSLLSLGAFAAGWPLYEYRDAQFPRLHLDARYLTPARLASARGVRVLVVWEIGLGDTIQFIRYLKLLHAAGAIILLSIQPGLRHLVAGLDVPVEHIDVDWRTMFRMGHTTTRFDFIIRMLSLPYLFQTTPETIPADIPYFAADPARVAHWQAVLGPAGRRIGINWQGAERAELGGRSFPIAALQTISQLPDVRLISLQKGADFTDLPDGMAVETLGAGFDAGPDAFLDSAAVMATLDLVITCDTAIAHLAGALGVRCWLVLGHVADWRWLRDRDTSPWYPSLRLFRQGPDKRWEPVFAAMAASLRADQ